MTSRFDKCDYCGVTIWPSIGILRVTNLKGSIFSHSGEVVFDLDNTTFCDSACLGNKIAEFLWIREVDEKNENER